MKKIDLWTVFGGICCVLFAYLDTKWSYFWIGTGIVLIGWSIIAVIYPNGKNGSSD